MKMVKSLLLGAAAGVVGVAGAQAADLPVKAKPVQYVKICSLYGAGFYYMPGTDTCLKVGGFVRAEMNFNANTSFAQQNRASLDQRTYNFTNTRARAAVTLDARSQTEYGTLRAYALIAEQIDTGTPFVNPQGLGGSDVRTWSNAFFIQFAGFTAGATASFFDFDLQPYSNQTNVLSSNAAGAGIPVFAYT
ncbi:MAG TPA: porin, partial [Rhizomicrobium sp.]|nr:porin [Rhizomicrobium sp.]